MALYILIAAFYFYCVMAVFTIILAFVGFGLHIMCVIKGVAEPDFGPR